MATHTVGTNANNSLVAVTFNRAPATLSDADLATVSQDIKTDLNSGLPLIYGNFTREGRLYVPRRGWLEVKVGDVVAVDTATGWPILLSANVITGGPWTYT